MAEKSPTVPFQAEPPSSQSTGVQESHQVSKVPKDATAILTEGGPELPISEPLPTVIVQAPTDSSQPQKLGFNPLHLGARVRERMTRKNSLNNQTTEAANDAPNDQAESQPGDPYGQDFEDKCRLELPDPDAQRPRPEIYIIAIHDIEEDRPWVYAPARERAPAGTTAQTAGNDAATDNSSRHRQTPERGGGVPNAATDRLALDQSQVTPSQLSDAKDSVDGGRGYQEQRPRTRTPPIENSNQPRRFNIRLGHQSKKKTSENEQYSSHPSTYGRTPSKLAVRWLEDSFMLPSILPGARVLKFEYPNPPAGETDWLNYVEKVTMQLLNKIRELEKTAGRTTPILYIGHGFGGLLLQKFAPKRQVRRDVDIGYIFLNTPFPGLWTNPAGTDSSGASRYTAFPSTQISRAYGLLSKVQAPGGGFLDTGLWEDFLRGMDGHTRRLPIAWFYRTYEVLPSITKSILFPIFGPSSSRFSSPDDADYRSIVAQLRSLIALHAARHASLISVLKMALETPNFPKYVRDGQDRSPLYLAASSQNLEAVTMLVEQARRGRLVLQNKDVNCQTPLHAAVKAAANLKPDGNREVSRKIIEILVWGTSNNNAWDRTGRTAWEYVDSGREDHAWLQALRDKYQGINKDDFDLKPFGSPDGKQAHVCKQSWTIVAEFYHSSESHRVICNQAKPSVYELLYQEVGPYQILLRTRRLDVDSVAFRWIHFPANNKQWVEDLFSGLSLQDSSMEKQQREGTRPPFKYLFPKAEKYTQAKITFEGRGQDAWPAPPAVSSPSTSRPAKQDQQAVAVFMPILSFETQGNLELFDDNSKVTKSKTIFTDDPQLDLASAYTGQGLHPRRPLDQFSYTSRGEDQIMPTLGWEAKNDSRAPALMVDQLWLWILHDGTVVTCFPDACDEEEEYNLKAALQEEVTETGRFESVEDLVCCIINLSVDFFARPGPQGATFIRCFQSAINVVAHAENNLFKNFQNIASKINQEGLPDSKRRKLIKNLLEFHEESSLLMQIRDIQDELNIVKSIVEQQKLVLDQLSRAIIRPDRNKHVRFLDVEETQAKVHGLTLRDILEASICTRVEDNIRVVSGMLEYAARIEHSIDHLLDLKQKQANALEARFAREGSEQTRRQGNIMLYWTTITIIFLPMSFLSSFFTIDISEFPKDASGDTAWPLRRVSGYLFGLSFALIIPLLIIGLFLRFSAEELADRFMLGRKNKGPGGGGSTAPTTDPNSINLSEIEKRGQYAESCVGPIDSDTPSQGYRRSSVDNEAGNRCSIWSRLGLDLCLAVLDKLFHKANAPPAASTDHLNAFKISESASRPPSPHGRLDLDLMYQDSPRYSVHDLHENQISISAEFSAFSQSEGSVRRPFSRLKGLKSTSFKYDLESGGLYGKRGRTSPSQ
ncbi:uncharacterized protein BJX67DRAFT_378956 [Aspergillus lucknowensis]|uniref:Ankyrin repeat protein n=1 Tax=Aspergillus lucknowensis TaxID=176173 RepID=A0ABR4LZS6_9EURO